jgi:KDO2-lipid IV(A) lauroyltransferase
MKQVTLENLKYQLGDLLAITLFAYSRLIFRHFSQKTLVLISRSLGTLAFILYKRNRERVVGNLSFVFGKKKGPAEIRRLAKEVFFHFTLTPLETIYLAAHGLAFDRFILKIRIEGKEHLDAALTKGNGVIALGAHLGSFTLLGSRLAVEGYRVNIMINKGDFPGLWKRLDAFHEVLGQKTFPPKPITTSLKKSLNCLQRNEILYLVADEQQRRRGTPVPFFGQQAFTPTGPAIFSLKTGAPILPMFVLREDETKRTLVIGNPIEIERTGDEKKDIERLTAKFTKVIEETIRQYPHQWAWLNRRWKLSRPREGNF